MTAIKNILIISAFVLLASKLLVTCEDSNVQKANVKAISSELKIYKLISGKNAYSISQLRLTNKQLNESVLSKDKSLLELSKKFNKVKTETKIIVETKIDTVSVFFKSEIPCAFKDSGSIKKEYFSMDYKINSKGLNLSNIKIPDTLNIVSGIKKKWFWGKETLSYDVSNSNPNVIITEMKSVEVKNPKAIYETTFFKVGLGFMLGYYLAR